MPPALRRGIRASIALAALAPFFAACSPAPAAPHGPGALALVVGGRSNMPRPQLIHRAQQIVRDAVLSRSTVFIVGVSGRPEILYTEQIRHDCDSTTACDSVVTDQVRKFNGLLDKVRAKSGEADTLGAILVAARALSGARSSGPKHLIVVDSGLQTAGDLHLQAPGAMSVEPATLTGQWEKEKKLQHLDRVQVLWTGLGAYHAPQEPVSPTVMSKLETLWTEILRAGGASVDSDPSPLPRGAPAGDLPPVTPVVFDDKPVGTPAGCFRIRDDQIGFLPGRADLRDPAKANEVLKPIARELIDKQLSATVVGTTALPEDPPFVLSKKRAQAVVSLLVGLGVPAASLTPGGVGNRFAGFVPDTDPSGRLIETLAVQNRLVIIQPVGQTCS